MTNKNLAVFVRALVILLVVTIGGALILEALLERGMPVILAILIALGLAAALVLVSVEAIRRMINDD